MQNYGIPLRINVGRDAAESLVEFKLRQGGEAKKVHVDEILNVVQEAMEA